MMRALLLLVLLLPAQDPGPAQKLAHGRWFEEEVGVGVVWRRCAFRNYAGGPQTIHLLEVDPEKKPAFKVEDAGAGCEKLSSFAAKTDAVAAVNGGFFGEKGNPIGLFKAGGHCFERGAAERGAIGWTKEGKALLRRVPASTDWEEAHEAIGAGPLLVEEGRALTDFTPEGYDNALFLGKNPRTAAGVTAAGRMLFAVVDGRTKTAAGMTMAELAAMMRELGCVTAVNLDGGGSSTMWVRGKPAGGVVNAPCDRTGERPVANGVLVLAKDVTVFDNDSPQFIATPANRWERISTMDGRSTGTEMKVQGESYSLAKQGLGVEAVWKLEVDWNGEYEVFARWPQGSFTKNAKFRVMAGVMNKEVEVDCSKGGGAWVSLGVHLLQKTGQIQAVELKASDDKPLAADAVKVVRK